MGKVELGVSSSSEVLAASGAEPEAQPATTRPHAIRAEKRMIDLSVKVSGGGRCT
jgi:hypothetical protein